MFRKNIANIFSLSRLVFSIFLFFKPLFSPWFFTLYILCGVSDVLDGFLARKLRIESRFGKHFDSFCDFFFILVCVYKIYGFVFTDKTIFLLITVIFILKLISFLKFKNLHTFANKISGLLLFLSVPFLSNSIVVYIISFLIFVLSVFDLIYKQNRM